MAVHARLLAENGKVVNESLSARSDLFIGEVILMFCFPYISPVLGFGGFAENPGSRPVSSVQFNLIGFQLD